MTTHVQRKVVLRLEMSRFQVPRPSTSGLHPTKDNSSIVEFIYSGKTMVKVRFDNGYTAKTTRAIRARYKEPSVLDLSRPYREEDISTDWKTPQSNRLAPS